jgi:hypothetical protein
MTGRKRPRLEENVRLDGGLDDKSTISPAGGRRRVRRRCIVALAVVCSLGAPATGRAADPFGTAQLTGEVNAAVAQATAAASEASEAASQASQRVSSAPTTLPAGSTTASELATKTADAAASQAAHVASTVGAQVQREFQSVATSPPAAHSVPARARVKKKKVQRHPHHAARTTASAPGARGVRSPIRTSIAQKLVPVASVQRPALSANRTERDSASARATSKPTARPMPQRNAPLPLPPRPGATSSGQGGGQGSPMPLVVGALASLLLMFALQFLPRTLPPMAFRKPRFLALPPWHPG